MNCVLIYKNDLSENSVSNPKSFADDTSPFPVVKNTDASDIDLNDDLWAIRDSFREKLYQELGFEALQQRRWYRKLCCFYKISESQSLIFFQLFLYKICHTERARQCNKFPAVN